MSGVHHVSLSIRQNHPHHFCQNLSKALSHLSTFSGKHCMKSRLNLFQELRSSLKIQTFLWCAEGNTWSQNIACQGLSMYDDEDDDLCISIVYSCFPWGTESPEKQTSMFQPALIFRPIRIQGCLAIQVGCAFQRTFLKSCKELKCLTKKMRLLKERKNTTSTKFMIYAWWVVPRCNIYIYTHDIGKKHLWGSPCCYDSMKFSTRIRVF